VDHNAITARHGRRDRTIARAWAWLLLALPAAISAQGPDALHTSGDRFWTGFPQNASGAQAQVVHIMGVAAATGTVSMPGTGWSTGFTVAPGEVAIVAVPGMAEHAGSGMVQDKGVLVMSSDTVNVFIASRQSYTQDMAQVLPESALGTSYRVEAQRGINAGGGVYKSQLLVVAAVDGTQVRITPSADTQNGPAGVPFTVDLDAGQSYQLQAAEWHHDLTGTLVEGTEASGPCRPFVVIGGSSCAEVPAGCLTCDMVFAQAVPRSAWGTRFHTVPVALVSATSYRVLADQDQTAVTVDGVPVALLDAGGTYLVNGGSAPVCIEADKPVSVVQFLETYACAGNGDPSMMPLAPAGLFSHDVSFRAQNTLVAGQHVFSLVVPTAAVGEVALDGSPIGGALFQAYAACPDMAHATLQVPPGLHRVVSDHGFQLHAIALGQGESMATLVQNIGGTSMAQDSVVCAGGSITLNVPEPMTGIQWSAASDPGVTIGTGASITVSPTASESYTVHGEAALTGCPVSFTYHVGVAPTVPAMLTANGGPTADICRYDEVALALVPPPDPAWSQVDWSPAWALDDPGSPNPVATPLEDTWFVVEVTSPSGCGDFTDSIFVAVSPGDVIDLDLIAEPAVTCAGNAVQLSSRALVAIAADRFNAAAPGTMWAGIQGGTLSDVCGSITGKALYFNGNGQRSAQTMALNTVGGGRILFALKIADGMAPCADAGPGAHVVLEYSTDFGAGWTPLATYHEDQYPAFTAIDEELPMAAQTAATMFRLRQLANNGAGHDNWALDDLVVGRYDGSALPHAWSGGPLDDPAAIAPIAQPAGTGWYTLVVTDPLAGCMYVDSVLVEVHPAFTLALTADTTICDIAGTVLQAVPSSDDGTTFLWAPDDGSISDPGSATPIVTPAATTTYTVQAVNAQGCTAQGSVTVTVGQLIGLQLGTTNDTICQGQSVTLSAVGQGGAGLIYTWTGPGLDDPASATPTATPAQTTTYTCTVQEPGSACALTVGITIVVNTGYTADAGPDLTVCAAVGHQLHVAHNVPGATYQWQPAVDLNSGSIQSPTIIGGAGGTWTVTVTDPNGCAVSDTVTLTEAFAGMPAPQTVAACADEPPVLQAPVAGAAYVWNTGATGPQITATESGVFTVTITDADGCEGHATFDVVLHALPVVDLGPDLALCGATDQVLDAGNTGSSFLWSTNAQTPQITVQNTGTYSVTVTNTHGCTATDAIHVAFHALPPDLLDDVTACITEPPTLNAGAAGNTYLWNTDETTPSIVAGTTGTYTVTVTTPQGCSGTFSAEVTIAPDVQVQLGADTMFCQGGSMVLDAGNAGPDHQWNTGHTTPTITVNATGTYSVTVSNAACSASDTIHVEVLPGPVDNLADITTCITETVVLDAGNSGATYLWGNGSSAQTMQATTSGPYSVTVTLDNGCSATHAATVQLVPLPVVALGSDTVLCEGETLVLHAGNPGSAYNWNTGATGAAIMVQQGGLYSVTVDNGHCERSDSIHVGFNPSPVRMALHQVFACLDEDPRHVRLDAGNPGSGYVWSTGAASQVILAGAYGWYYVDVTNIFDCAARDSVLVSEYCPSAIYVPNTFTPNGDGLNDVFIPVGKNIASMQLLIFDRWGGVIFESNDPRMGWDGTFRGEPVKEDIYMWKLRYKFMESPAGGLGMEQERLGHIQVMR
jgi:gliding motility-associated-like protein